MNALALSETDVADFDAALALLFVVDAAEDPSSIDCATHMRTVCGMALQRLCDIRNRRDASGSAMTLAEIIAQGGRA